MRRRNLIAIAGLALALQAQAQVHLNFPTQAACAAAAASIVGPAGGTANCTTTSTKIVSVPATGIPIAAVCDGVTDNSAAIKAAIDKAKPLGVPVLVPTGTCAYGDVITLDGVKLIGQGDASVLFSLNVSRAAIFLRGSGAEVRSLKLAGVTPTARSTSGYDSNRIVPFGASNWVIDNVTVTSSAGTGVYSTRASSDGRITNSRISGTLADGIHLTDKTSYVTVQGNRIEGTGDDGVAVVSTQEQLNPVHHITAVANVVTNNKGGRSMSVVGGADVLYENNRLSNSGNGACMYLAQEDSYKTLADSRIMVRNNSLTNCGGPVLGHAAVMLFANSLTNDGITVQRNDIVQGPTQVGIRVFGSNTGVVIDGNRITGATTPMQLASGITATPYTTGPVGPR